jgi:beta-phosphoglucomutase-like phosphatase (HAD superfamily)
MLGLPRSLGLPESVAAGLFDLDGVLTMTAKVHAAAWKEMFDDFLAERARQTGETFVPFDAQGDYDEYVDGKPRMDGVRSFLAGARALGVDPAQAAVFEDALAGVAAGRASDFGLVVGVDRVGQAAALREHGAEVVETDLADLLD